MRFVQSFILVIIPILLCTAQGVDYYWVGGSGDWSDITHWSTTSGGNVQHSVLPTADDNVIFDQNSFKNPGEYLNINRDNVFCKNMDWTQVTNPPAITGDANVNININGSLNFHAGIELQYQGSFYFSGEGEQSIDLAGLTITGNLTINGEFGSNWNLINDLDVRKKILIQGGNFNSNEFNIQCHQLFIESKNLATFDISNSTLQISGGLEFLDPSLRLRTDNTDWIDANANIVFQGENSFVQVLGLKKAHFNRMTFIHPEGKSYILAETQYYKPAPVKINYLGFKNSGFIYGSNEIDYLKLNPGCSYQFENQRIQTIGIMDASGDCAQPITISSTVPGDESFFQFTQANNLSYVNLWDIHVSNTDNIAINITQATAGQNVQGWNLDMRGSQTLYWVGGQGNWSDPSHWSLTSGGAGGACIPTFTDDVVFDARSFSMPSEKVSVDVPEIYFRTMRWEEAPGMPVFEGSKKSRLHIHGSIILQEHMSWDFKGDLYFDAVNESHDIDFAGHLIHKDIFFEGFNAEWHLKDDLKVKERIFYNRSTLYTNSHKIEVEAFYSYGSFTRALYLENSYVLVRSLRNFLVNWSLEKVNFHFDAGTSTIEFVGHTGVFNNIGNASVDSILYHTIIFSSEKSSSISTKSFRTRIKHAYYLSNVTIRGNHSYQKLVLSPGFTYSFGASGELFVVDSLVANGNCNNPISILSQSQSEPAKFLTTNPQRIHYVSLEGIEIIGNGDHQAYNAIDLGNNHGWSFEAVASRTLYWVGNSGNWHDPQNWAIMAGGDGGECLPTPTDHVIFDKTAFSRDSQVIFTEKDKIAVCQDFIWDGAHSSTRLNLGEIQVFGSFILNTDLNAHIERIILKGTEQHEINLGEEITNNLVMNTSGTYTLTGKVTAGVINLINGDLVTNGQDVQATYFDVQAYSNPCRLDCSNSSLTLTGEGSKSRGSFSVYGDKLEFIAENSVFQLTHENAKLYAHGALDFDKVIFTSKTGFSSLHSNALSPTPKPLISFNELRFRNNAEILGPHIIDSLYFSSGKGYVLESGVIQRIRDYWQMQGNNCSQIKLSASSPGLHSIVEKSQGEVHADFVQMQDQIAIGGAGFYAGYNSTDVNGSNEGWQFVTQDEDLLHGVLGADKALCRNETFILNGKKTIEAEQYVWSNGSVGETIDVVETGVYWVQASFTQNCTIIDSVKIEVHNDLKPVLGSDTTICAGEDIELATTQVVNAAHYTWQDGTVGYSIQATDEGEYVLTAAKDHCIEADTISIQVFDPAEDVIPEVLEACENTTIQLAIHLPDVDVIWNTGSVDKTIEVHEPGAYWARIIRGGCSWEDTTIVSFLEGPSTNLPDTVRVCEDERVVLDVTLRIPLGNNTYAEFTEPFIDSLVKETQAFYYYTSDGKCPLIDSIRVEVQDKPYLLVDSLISLCPNTTTTLLADSDAEEILWNTGAIGPTLTVAEPGEYAVIAHQKGCMAEKSIRVESFEGFDLALPSDTVICYDNELRIDATVPNGIEYQWSNGVQGPVNILNTAGTYWVEVSNLNCAARDSIQIEISNCNGMQVFIPNIFSPNGDGNNDMLKAYVSSEYQLNRFKMQVFDRWGNKIFETEDVNEGWDGRKYGKLMDAQVYVCIVSLSYQHPEGILEEVFSSDVFLNR